MLRRGQGCVESMQVQGPLLSPLPVVSQTASKEGVAFVEAVYIEVEVEESVVSLFFRVVARADGWTHRPSDAGRPYPFYLFRFLPSVDTPRFFFSSDDRCFQVDILQDAVAVSATASSESIGRSSRRGGGDAVAPGVAGRGEGHGRREEGEEEEVVSLRLVGLGMQLHSKSYGARFSFSMQDLDLEVRILRARVY